MRLWRRRGRHRRRTRGVGRRCGRGEGLWQRQWCVSLGEPGRSFTNDGCQLGLCSRIGVPTLVWVPESFVELEARTRWKRPIKRVIELTM